MVDEYLVTQRRRAIDAGMLPHGGGIAFSPTHSHNVQGQMLRRINKLVFDIKTPVHVQTFHRTYHVLEDKETLYTVVLKVDAHAHVMRELAHNIVDETHGFRVYYPESTLK